MSWRPILLAVLLVLAGCSSVPDSPSETTGATDSTPDADHKPKQSDPPTPVPDASNSNPWGEDTLVVSIDAPPGDDRNYTSLVRPALAYWSEQSERYAYPIDYRLDPDASDPDITVSFVERVNTCNNISEAAGCAPYITSGAGISRPAKVQVRTGLSNESTRLVVKHELGHTLGLNHSNAPREVMAANTQLTVLPQPNATERALPWSDSELTVFVDYGNASNVRAVRTQVNHALSYYESGAAGTVPENVSFQVTRNRSEADVIIDFPPESPCSRRGGSCGYRFGHDVDGDGELETYNRLRVTVTDIDADAVGWHVGYWLGYGFGFAEDRDWAEPFRDATYRERRSNWWR